MAEYCVGIIAGSVPPCRALVIQMIHQFRGEAPARKNTVGVPNTRFRHSSLHECLSKITIVFSWSRARANPKASGELKNSKNLYIPMKPWNRKHNRFFRQDSGRENILPLHTMPSARLKTGILKTVDVNVGTGETGSGGTAN